MSSFLGSDDEPSVPETSNQMKEKEKDNESSCKTTVHTALCAQLSPQAIILKWVCMVMLKIYFKCQLTKGAFLAICGLTSTLLQLIGHPLYKLMPTSMHEIFNVAAATQVEKVTYVVCPNDVCNQLYKPIDAERVLTCTNVIFGKVCTSELGYYRSLAFSMKWTPHKVFHFISPSAWLRHFFKSNLFCNLLQGFKPIPISPNRVLKDVHDGNVWQDFLVNPLNPSEPFLSNAKNNVAFLLNVDWFKPFKHSEYKVSAIMMTVLNLPRSERFKSKWTLILGVIPGPTEPKGHINTFLKPIVDDLLDLWNGIPIHPKGNTIRAALVGVSADMSALRKVAQFLGHKADLGCSRCVFQAEREPGKKGASGKMSYV